MKLSDGNLNQLFHQTEKIFDKIKRMWFYNEQILDQFIHNEKLISIYRQVATPVFRAYRNSHHMKLPIE